MATDNKDVTLTIRLPRSLRDAFQEATSAADITASQVLRAAIRQYLTRLPGTVRPSVIAEQTVAAIASSPITPVADNKSDVAHPEIGTSALDGVRAMLELDED